MASKKRKRDVSVDTELCVIHFEGSSSEHFTPLTEERLLKLKEIQQKRLDQPLDSPYRMQDACRQIPDIVVESYGYHRDCYKRFTSNLARLSLVPVSTEPSATRPPRRPSDGSNRVIFNPDCIFCGKTGWKKVKHRGSWTTQPTCKFEFGGGETVLQVAEQKKDFDLLRRIKGYDLFACEAQYHRSCRSNYILDPLSWQSTDSEAVSEQAELEREHQKAFSNVCAIIDENIIIKKAVLKLEN